MGLMYDSTTAADIPVDAEFVGGYVNGLYAWDEEDWNRFPNAHLVSIVVYIPGNIVPNRGDVLDVEAEYVFKAPTLTRRIAQDWVADRLAAGGHPVIYTSLDSADNFRGLYCSYWLADYTGVPHMVSVPGLDVVATQYASPAYGSGGHYDLSITIDNWPSRAGKVPPLMANILAFQPSKTGEGYWVVTTDGVYAYGDIAAVNGHPDPMLTADTFFDFVPTPSGKGYWLVDKNANLYAYGDAPFFGHP